MRLHSTAPLALVSLAMLAGCSKGCGHDHPYVPYSIDSTSTPPAGDDAGATSPEEADAASGHARAASVAPPNVSSWTVDGVPVTAPEGFILVLGLADDFDGDGKKDAFAVVRATTHDQS